MIYLTCFIHFYCPGLIFIFRLFARLVSWAGPLCPGLWSGSLQVVYLAPWALFGSLRGWVSWNDQNTAFPDLWPALVFSLYERVCVCACVRDRACAAVCVYVQIAYHYAIFLPLGNL